MTGKGQLMELSDAGTWRRATERLITMKDVLLVITQGQQAQQLASATSPILTLAQVPN